MRSNDHTERVPDYLLKHPNMSPTDASYRLLLSDTTVSKVRRKLVVEGKLQPLQRKPAREHYRQRPSKGGLSETH